MLNLPLQKPSENFKVKDHQFALEYRLYMGASQANSDQLLQQWYKGELDEIYLKRATIRHYINKSSLIAGPSRRDTARNMKFSINDFFQ